MQSLPPEQSIMLVLGACVLGTLASTCRPAGAQREYHWQVHDKPKPPPVAVLDLREGVVDDFAHRYVLASPLEFVPPDELRIWSSRSLYASYVWQTSHDTFIAVRNRQETVVPPYPANELTAQVLQSHQFTTVRPDETVTHTLLLLTTTPVGVLDGAAESCAASGYRTEATVQRSTRFEASGPRRETGGILGDLDFWCRATPGGSLEFSSQLSPRSQATTSILLRRKPARVSRRRSTRTLPQPSSLTSVTERVLDAVFDFLE